MARHSVLQTTCHTWDYELVPASFLRLLNTAMPVQPIVCGNLSRVAPHGPSLRLRQVVFHMRAAMDTLFVRLTALEAMVMQKPIITGRYSESPYINFMKPIEARWHASRGQKEV